MTQASKVVSKRENIGFYDIIFDITGVMAYERYQRQLKALYHMY